MSGSHIKVVHDLWSSRPFRLGVSPFHYDQFHHYGIILAPNTRVLLHGERPAQWEKKARNGSLPPLCVVR